MTLATYTGGALEAAGFGLPFLPEAFDTFISPSEKVIVSIDASSGVACKMQQNALACARRRTERGTKVEY